MRQVGEFGMMSVGMAQRLKIADWEWEIVSAILARYLPGRTVWAFGSRSTGRHLKRFSDLDLAVEGRLTAGEGGAVRDAFDESLVSFRVDVVEMETVDAEFRERIRRDLLIVQGSQAGDRHASP